MRNRWEDDLKNYPFTLRRAQGERKIEPLADVPFMLSLSKHRNFFSSTVIARLKDLLLKRAGPARNIIAHPIWPAAGGAARPAAFLAGVFPLSSIGTCRA
jgi:hypothetical protein